MINNKQSLKASIPKIGDFLDWLGKVGKDELINYYNENMRIEEKVNDAWYEKLFMYKFEIIVTEEGHIGAQTCLDDNYYGKLGSLILRIDMFEKEIHLMEY